MTVQQVQVVNIATTSNQDSAQPTMAGGRQGEGLISEIHGKWYTAAYRGNLFFATTATAGTTVPVQATNMVGTMMLWNPSGSGKNVEMVRYSAGILTAANQVVSDISLYYQVSVGSSSTVPSALTTALTIRNCMAGAGLASVCTAWSSSTLAGTIITNIFKGPTLWSESATTSTNTQPIVYDFDGSFILPPGTLITTAGNAVQTNAMQQTWVWAEYLI